MNKDIFAFGDSANSSVSEFDSGSISPKIDFKRNKITHACNGLEAVVQDVVLRLSTPADMFEIHEEQYGLDYEGIFSSADPAIVLLRLREELIAALGEDDRITGVSDIGYRKISANEYEIEFTVYTIYGNVEMGGVIND